MRLFQFPFLRLLGLILLTFVLWLGLNKLVKVDSSVVADLESDLVHYLPQFGFAQTIVVGIVVLGFLLIINLADQVCKIVGFGIASLSPVSLYCPITILAGRIFDAHKVIKGCD